jgi:hypothetical protein
MIPAFPVRGGSGVRGGIVGGVVPGGTTTRGGTPTGTGIGVTATGEAVGVAVGAAVGVTVAAAVGVTVGVAVGATVGVAVGVGVATWTFVVTVAEQRVSAPPPFADPLHWSTLIGRVALAVEPPLTEQMKPTLVPPLPEPLH